MSADSPKSNAIYSQETADKWLDEIATLQSALEAAEKEPERPYLRVRIDWGNKSVQLQESERLCKMTTLGEGFVVFQLVQKALSLIAKEQAC